jgi:glucose/arabinose dehydrogenase
MRLGLIRTSVAGVFVAAASIHFAGQIAPPAPLLPGQTDDPFPQPIPPVEGVITVGVREFATLPDIEGVPARMMLLVDEPGTRRLFVNDMRGPLYTLSYDGKTVAKYIDINDPRWGVSVQSMGRERGFQSFALHPQFGQPNTPGFGKFYTYTDTSDQTREPTFGSSHPSTTHDTVLLEWTAKIPSASTYDGGAPRELFRLRQPFANHNAGHLAFHPLAGPGSPEFGLLYVGVADGGSGGDPMGLAQNLGSAFGKVFRIDPLGKSGTRQYGIPADNPFVNKTGVLPEIYAFGVRNPQRFGWDTKTGRLFLADIGQGIVEEISPVIPGANLGWNAWEGSFRYVSRQAVSLEGRRSDQMVTYPVVEWGQSDPLLQSNSAATGVVVYRGTEIPQLANLLIFADMPGGEIFYVQADKLPNGGQDSMRRILFRHNGASKTMLELIQEKNTAQGKTVATRSDLRFGVGPNHQVFLLNKGDGVVRLLVR